MAWLLAPLALLIERVLGYPSPLPRLIGHDIPSQIVKAGRRSTCTSGRPISTRFVPAPGRGKPRPAQGHEHARAARHAVHAGPGALCNRLTESDVEAAR